MTKHLLISRFRNAFLGPKATRGRGRTAKASRKGTAPTGHSCFVIRSSFVIRHLSFDP